jgi:hypothetical protein
MGRISKTFDLFLILTIAMSCLTLLTVKPASAQSSATPQLEWSKTYPRPPVTTPDNYNITHIDEGSCFVQTSDGGYAILGSIEDSYYVGEHSGPHQNRTGIIIKTDSLGNLQWQKTDSILLDSQSIFQTEDLGYMIVRGGYLLKMDALGNIQSNKTIGVSISSALQTSDNSYVLVGSNGKSILLIKIDSENNLLLNKTLMELTDFAPSISIVEANDGGYFIVVKSSNFLIRGGIKDPNYWLIKTSSTGEVQFNKASNYYEVILGEEQSPASLAYAFTIATNDGGYLLAGRAYRDSRVAFEGVSYSAPFLVKLDSQGNWQWSRSYATSHRDSGFFSSAVQTVDCGFLIAGSYDSQPIGWIYGSYISPFLLKTDSFGNVQLNQTFSSIDDYHEGHASLVIVTRDGGYAIMGSLDSSVWLAKFAPESGISPSPSIPEFSWLVIVPLLLAVFSVAVILKHRKTTNLSK